MKYVAALTVCALALGAQTERSASRVVTAVRHSSARDITKVFIEVSGPFEFTWDHLQDPERVYFDIHESRARVEGKRLYSENVEDRFLKRVRVAEPRPGTTRVVLDVNGPVDATPTRMSNPERLMIELRARSAPATLTEAPAVKSAPAPPPSPVLSKMEEPKPELPKPEPVRVKPVEASPRLTNVVAAQKSAPPPAPPAPIAAEVPAVLKPDPMLEALRKSSEAKAAEMRAPEAKPTDLRAVEPRPVEPKPETRPADPKTADTAERKAAPIPELSKPARHTSSGETSLVRALGLKVTRVVIDPGHGGHDQGTEGPKGLLEKDLVLDVANRVGKLIEDKMGAEVIYTRTDDTFIPLEGRTALANERKADLFLSIHANSSPVRGITGVETYYLNFTGERDALEVASRENASSEKSIFELRDLIQKITAHDKAEESKEFASRIQSSLYQFSSRNFPGTRNRGVKKAPFVVLIGANMPSVLAEIGFVSNAREEALLKKPDYRQRLAEALFRGLSKYADSLSHFQFLQAQGQ